MQRQMVWSTFAPVAVPVTGKPTLDVPS